MAESRSPRASLRPLVSLALLGLLASTVLTAARPAAHTRASTTLTVWWSDWGKVYDDLMVKATDVEYRKLYPNTTVKWTFFSNLEQKLLTAIAGGAPPDMAYINSTQSQAWAQKGVLLPLDNYFKAAGLKKIDFVAASFPPYEYNGHLYALLNSGDFEALLWNKDVFKAAGLDPNHGPRTIQELVAYNAKLFKFDSGGHIIQAGLFPDQVGLPTWALQFGGDWVDRVHHKVTANDPHIVQALQWMLDQSKKWGQSNEDRFRSALGGRYTVQDPFYTGKLAMYFTGDWDFLTEAQFAPHLHTGVTPLPTAGHGLRLWDEVSWATSIPKGSAHVQEAWQLMQWLTTGPQAAKVIADTANFLAYKPQIAAFFQDTYKVMGPKNPMRQDFHVFQDQIVPNTVAQTYWDIPVASFYDQEIGRAVSNVLHGKDTPKHALDMVTQRVQKEWDNFKPTH